MVLLLGLEGWKLGINRNRYGFSAITVEYFGIMLIQQLEYIPSLFILRLIDRHPVYSITQLKQIPYPCKITFITIYKV